MTKCSKCGKPKQWHSLVMYYCPDRSGRNFTPKKTNPKPEKK